MHTNSSPIAFALGFWLIFCFPGYALLPECTCVSSRLLHLHDCRRSRKAGVPAAGGSSRSAPRCRRDIPYKLLTRQRFVELLFGYINSISCGHAITSWGQDNAMNNVHLERCGGSGTMMILCGMLAGCGGGILAAWMHMAGATEEWAFSTPPVLKGPSITVRTAFMTSVIYYLLRNPHAYFSYGTDAFLSVLLPPISPRPRPHILRARSSRRAPCKAHPRRAGLLTRGARSCRQHEHAKAAIWAIWLVVLTAHESLGISRPWDPLARVLGKALNCPAEVGGAPADGVYEQVFGQAGKERVQIDAALAGFGFQKDKETKKSK
jgi:hypothetical protein